MYVWIGLGLSSRPKPQPSALQRALRLAYADGRQERSLWIPLDPSGSIQTVCTPSEWKSESESQSNYVYCSEY